MADPAGPGGAPNTPASSQIVDTVSIENLKTIAGSSAFAMAQLASMSAQVLGMQMQNAASHQNRINAISEAHLAKTLNTFSSVDPQEAVATAKLFKGESDSAIASLIAQTAAGHQTAKVAQSTPGDLSGDLARLTASVSSQGQQIAALIALTQQLMKGAQSTPPETAKPAA